ncbi:MAG: ROK family protein [Candidatus Brocadiia bacterium]
MRTVVGLDIGGSSIKAGIVGEDLKILVSEVIPVDRGSATTSIARCVTAVEKMESRCGGTSIAVGIACPGPYDGRKDILMKLPNLPAWEGFPLREAAAESFGKPTFLENDANAAALAESRLGAGVGAQVMLMVTLGTGVGGGIVWNGNVLRGSHGFAGEFGHITIDPEGPECGCGKRGCLESYVGSRAILDSFRTMSGIAGASIPMSEIVTQSKAGKEPARSVMAVVGARLGFALGGLGNALDPDVIIVGGGIANAGIPLFDALKFGISRAMMPAMRGGIEVRAASLGNEAGLLGAAIMALEGISALHS